MVYSTSEIASFQVRKRWGNLRHGFQTAAILDFLIYPKRKRQKALNIQPKVIKANENKVNKNDIKI